MFGIATALAEAAEEKVTQLVPESSTASGVGLAMSFFIVGYTLFAGLFTLISGRLYGFGKTEEAYTAESVKRFTRPYGIGMILASLGFTGIFLNTDHVLDMPLLLWLGAALTAAGFAVIGYGWKKTLVKK